ncbi:UrcA family protein [Novosphingobium sp. BL-8A]|uniref:UrcA family protein n=1 Tax=Novosphingobium sp. BL-8A TaxID=3127639 RepID=UPI0037580584
MLKATLAVLAACTISSAVYAAEPENPLAKSSVMLKLDGLDLSTVQGQRTLDLRMAQAARAVCGDRLATIHLALAAQSRACQAEVKADIRSRIEQQMADAGNVRPASYNFALR